MINEYTLIEGLIKILQKKKTYNRYEKLPLEIYQHQKIKFGNLSNLKILILNAPCNGFGDVVFGMKLRNYLHEWYNCDVKIVYNVGKNEIENYIKDTNKKPINSKISILYQPDNPTQFEIKQDNHMSASTMGYIMIAVGFVFGILIGMNYYFVSKYKPYAALTGLNRTGKFISDML